MPAANLAIIIKMSGGSLPPNTRAGDVEIYDNGRLVIYETDTDLVERQIDRQTVLDVLQFARQSGFFQLQNIVHDGGNAANVPDVTISLNDSMGTATVTMTNYQRLKGEMRKEPFDLVYKRITDLAWESYTNGKPFAEAPQQQPVAPLEKPSFSQTQAGKPSIELPSLDDLLKSSNLDFGPALSNSPSLPALDTRPAPQQTQQAPSLPSMPPTLPNLQTGQSAPSLPPLAPQQVASGTGGGSLPPLQQQPRPPQNQQPQQQQRPPQQPQQVQQPKPQPQQPPVQQAPPAPQPKNEMSPVAPTPVQEVEQPKPQPVEQPAPQEQRQPKPQSERADTPAPSVQQRQPERNEQRQERQEKPRQQSKNQDMSRRITMKHPPVGWEHTQELIGRLEESLKGKLLCIYIDAEHEVTMDDMRYLYSHLRKSGSKKTLYVLPIIPSGQLPVVWRMATLLREFTQELVFILPDAASVFSTMLSLSGDSILMNPLGYLSPIETSFTHQLLQGNSPVSLSEVLQASQLSQENASPKSKNADQSNTPAAIHPLVVTAAQRQLSLIQLLCTNLIKLNPKGPKDDAAISKVVTQITSSFLSSDYPITLQEVKSLGLAVSETSEEMNDLLWELIKHYRYISQPVLALRDDYRSLEQQTALIETVGRRTLYYKEIHEDLRKDQILDSYNRWRELTMQLSISQSGKEHTELQWRELQIVGQFD